jgi:hypothetical protein
MSVQVAYDTVLPMADTPLMVEFEMRRNAFGYPSLWAKVAATNLSRRSLVGESGKYCHWLFTAYDNPERAGEPLWSGEDKGCREAGLWLEMQPGATQVFPTTFLDGFAQFATARGPGTYYLAARLRGWLEDEPPQARWLTERVPAGAVVLVP